MSQLRVSDGTRLAYELVGPPDAPAAVLCDGIACDGFAWRYLQADLARRFRVLHVHNRGHGRSGLPRDVHAVTIPRLTRDVGEVMDHVGLGPAVFLGHSMGVQIALEMAWRQPERVRAGVLCCGAWERPLATFKHTDMGMRLLPRLREWLIRYRGPFSSVLKLVLPTRVGYVLAGLAELNLHRVRREDVMPYLEHVSRMPLDLFFAMLEDAAERTSAPFLNRLTRPMLVLVGENDGFTPSYVGIRLVEQLPTAELELLPEGTHTAPLELPELIGAQVNAFLDRHALCTPADAPLKNTAPLTARWRRARRRRAA